MTRERSLRLGGVRLNVREVGEGPPVLLINGIGTHTAMWAPLERALHGFHLVEFDAPGTGQSATPRHPVTIPALAWLAGRVLEAAEVERADLVGYSMGGLVAQQLAVSEPSLVRRLVLVGTSCGWGGVPGTLGPMLNIVTPLRYWSPDFYRRTIGNLAGGRARRDLEWVERHGKLRLLHPPTVRGYLGQVWSISLWTSLTLLHRISQPTLLVAGEDDPLVPPANALLLARRLQNARVLIAADEGHLLLMDPDSAVLEPIHEFLAAVSLDEAKVWQDAKVATDDDVRAAIAATRRQAQPWGLVSAVLRRLSPAPNVGASDP